MPRSPTHRVGRPGANSSVSETSAKSAFSSGGFEATKFAIPSPPTSSSPSSSTRTFSGSLPLAGQQRFQRLHLRPHLALVVHRAAGVDVAVAFGGLEGRREPLVQRIGRLHVVVPINQHRGLARGVQPVGIDQRVARGLNQPHVLHADALQLRRQHLGGLRQSPLCSGSVEIEGIRSRSFSSFKKAGVVLACKLNRGQRHRKAPFLNRQKRV